MDASSRGQLALRQRMIDDMRMFGEINEKQAEYIGDILESGRHLLSLINDIRDLPKIEAGRMELELTDFDLASTIEGTLILVRERAQRRGIMLGRTVDERLGIIRADERKVKQVLHNLLSNAMKLTDTGVGIAAADQEAVLEEFRQVGTADKKVEGTGLGSRSRASSSNCTAERFGSPAKSEAAPRLPSRCRCDSRAYELSGQRPLCSRPEGQLMVELRISGRAR